MSRLARAFGLILTVSTLAAGCGGQPAPQTGAPAAPAPRQEVVINAGLEADPPQLDPHLSTAVVDRQVQNNLFDKLVDLDEKLNIVPMLAERWEVSPDGKTYTFFLRKGVTFHDGTPFNAEAVKFNFERMLDKSLGSPRLSEISPVDKVTVVDEYTVRVDLKAPYAPFLGMLADRAGMMVSPTAARAAGKDFGLKPIGTGPFKFAERVKGDHLVLVRNENYWRQGLPKADKVVYKVFVDRNVGIVNLQAGQIDILNNIPSKNVAQVRNLPGIKLINEPSLGYQGLWLNLTQPPFDNPLLRRALEAATDRDALIKAALDGMATPAYGPFPAAMPVHDGAAPPKRDVARAKAYLQQAGKSDGFSFTLSITPDPAAQLTAQVLQNMWAEAGIKAQIEQVEWGQLLDRLRKGQFQASPVGWSGRAEPDGNIYQFFYTGGGNNYARYSNKTVDSLLDKARTVSNLQERKQVYTQVLQILREDVPYIFLYITRMSPLRSVTR